MNKYEFVLFDLDGTLLDTSSGVLKSIDYTIEACGFDDISVELKQNFIGPPIINSLKNTYNLSYEKAVEATNIFREAYKSKYLYEADLYDNISELILKLNRENIKIGVATYKRDDYAKDLLKKFNIMQSCDYIIGSDFNNTLTKTDIMKICLENLGCMDFNKAVMIGDTNHDANGAKEIGVDFIAVTYGFGFKTIEDAKSYNPVFIAENPKDIIGFLAI